MLRATSQTTIRDVLAELHLICTGCSKRVPLLDVKFKPDDMTPICPHCNERMTCKRTRGTDPVSVHLKKSTLSLVNELRGFGARATAGALAMLPSMERE